MLTRDSCFSDFVKDTVFSSANEMGRQKLGELYAEQKNAFFFVCGTPKFPPNIVQSHWADDSSVSFHVSVASCLVQFSPILKFWF